MLLTSNPKLSQVLLYFWSVILIKEVITAIAQNDHQQPPHRCLILMNDPIKSLAPQVFFKFRGTLSFLKFSITAPVVVFLLTALIVITPFLRKVIQMVRLDMTSREVGNSGSWQRMSSPWSPVVRSLKRDFNERRRIHRSRALAACELGVRSSCRWAELILCLFFSLLLILLIFNHFELLASYLVYCILHAKSA